MTPWLKRAGRRFGTVAGLIGLCLLLWALTPHFLTIANALNVMEQTAINAIVAVGMTYVIIAGGIDLSVGSIVAFSGVTLAAALKAGWPAAGAVAAVLLTARLNTAQPIAGIMYELDAIAATVIGGTSLSGGEGTLGGTLIGALTMGVLRNGLNLLGVSSFLQQVVIGLVIIVAVLTDLALKRQRT